MGGAHYVIENRLHIGIYPVECYIRHLAGFLPYKRGFIVESHNNFSCIVTCIPVNLTQDLITSCSIIYYL